jgi:hypothetical protein
MKTWDFVRLFTSIPLTDLKARMHYLIDKVFEYHAWPRHDGSRVSVTVFQAKKIPLLWDSHVPPQDAWCEDDSEHGHPMRQQVFKAKSMQDMLDFMPLDHTYVTFIGGIYRQHSGIPMGISFAVHLANYYLYSYEYDFITRLHHLVQQSPPRSGMPASGVLAALQPALVPGVLHNDPNNPPFWPNPADIAYAVIDSYAYTVRYVDDMLSIANPVCSELMYTSQTWHGIAGIYHGPYRPAIAATALAPAQAAVPGLELKQAGSGHCLSYLDVFVKTILKAVQPTGIWVDLITVPYAKHRDGPLKGLGVIKYPHISCDLAAQVKYNILNTEWHRWMRRITPWRVMLSVWRILCMTWL